MSDNEKMYAIYARYSSDRQRETSIEDQVRRCREYIQGKGVDPDRAEVFSDFALSGSSLQRPGFEALMDAIDDGAIQAVVTESLDRISRDFADSASIFKRLQYAQVPLIGVSDGINTADKNAKLSFTVKSLLSDMYLDELRDKTLRGLEGRAIAGRATGSVPYGFRTVPADDGLGNLIEVSDDARTVRRIFRLYRDGYSYKRIAQKLNQEGVPSPRAKTRHSSRGWTHTQIRSMLRNEKYAGSWSFNQTQWVKAPGSSKRTPRKRKASDVITVERPELRIIGPELWDQVQKRLEDVRKRYAKGTPSVASRAVYPLSGLLYCSCGAPMTIYGGSKTAKRYRCTDNFKRGTCDNSLSLREDVARKYILRGVKDSLMKPAAIDFVRKELAKGLGDLNRDMDAELTERKKRLARTEKKIAGLIDYIANGDHSDYITQTLQDLESMAKQEKSAIRSLEEQAQTPIDLPSLDELVESVFDVEAAIAADPVTGREKLHKLFRQRRIDLRVDGDVYVAESALLPLMALEKPEKNIGAPDERRRYIGEVAGARFSPYILTGFAHLELPFSERLAA